MKRFIVMIFSFFLALMILTGCAGPVVEAKTTVSISGQLLDGYTSQWKVGIGESSGGYYTFSAYGTVDSVGNFRITAPVNLGLRIVIAFRDDNANSRYDNGETVASVKPQVTIVSSDISGIEISIPSITILHVVGKLTNNFTTVWKVGLAAEHPLTHTPMFFRYGIVNGTGDFTIIADEYTGSCYVAAYKDANGNNTCDSDEFITPDYPTINIVSSDISNVLINIPVLQSISIYGNVKGNIFGLPVGVLLFNTNTGTLKWSAPNTALNFSYAITLDGIDTNVIQLTYYIDRNGNGKFDGDLSTLLVESMGWWGDAFEVTDSLSNDFQLIGKILKGSVTGTAASDFDCVWLSTVNAGFQYAPISGSSYTLKFYILSNTNTMTVSSVSISLRYAEGDTKLNIPLTMVPIPLGKVIFYTNDIPMGNEYSAFTNTANFVANKCLVVNKVHGADASLFKIANLSTVDYFNMTYHFSVANQGSIFTNYFYGNGEFYNMSATYKDFNGDNDFYLKIGGSPIVFDPFILFENSLSNTTYFTNHYYLEKCAANVTVSGNISGYSNPKIYCQHTSTGAFYGPYPCANQTISIYYDVTNGYDLAVDMFVYDDLNWNNLYDSGFDPVLSTNSVSWTNPAALTNITLYVTN